MLEHSATPKTYDNVPAGTDIDKTIWRFGSLSLSIFLSTFSLSAVYLQMKRWTMKVI
jgi:hypothetical protein